MKTYTVVDVQAFYTLLLPLPLTTGLVFWSQGTAGGVLLLPGIHYRAVGVATFGLFQCVPLSIGDRITVVG